MDIPPVIIELIQEAFDAETAPRVLADLEAAELPLLTNHGPRIQAALLILSNGDYQQFQEHLRIAKIDWRDTLVASGLGHGNWRSVLAERGIVLPESTD